MRYIETLRQSGLLERALNPMTKKFLFTSFFVGLAVAIAEIAYFQFAYYHQILTPDGLWLLLLCLNPPSFLGVIFIDVTPTPAQEVILGSAVALLNGTLYALVAKLFLRIRRKSA